MLVTLNMIVDFLKNLNPIVSINNSKQNKYKGFKLLDADNHKPLLPDYIYLCFYSYLLSHEEELENMSFICTSIEVPINFNNNNQNNIILITNYSPSALFNDINDFFINIKEWDSAITLSVAENKGYQHLLDLSESVIGNPIVISGPTFNTFAYTKNSQTDDETFIELSMQGYLSSEKVLLYERLGFFREQAEDDVIRTRDPFGSMKVKHMIKPFHYNKQPVVYATMWCSNREPGPALIELFEYLCQKIYKLVFAEFSNQTLTQKQYEFLLVDLIRNKNMAKSELSEKLRYANIDIPTACNYFVIKIQFKDFSSVPVKFIIQYIIQRIPFSRPFLYDQSIGILLIEKSKNKSTYGSIYKVILDLINEHEHDCYIGVSSEFKNIIHIHDAYEQATIAINIGSKITENKYLEKIYGIKKKYDTNTFLYNDYYLYHIVNCSNIDSVIKNKSYKDLLALIDYDNNHSSDKVKFLYTYITNTANVTQTAKIMCMHRNSVIYKINRIEELLKIDLSSYQCLIDMYISYMFLEIVDTETNYDRSLQ